MKPYPSVLMSNSVIEKRLILHFDINKSILISDGAVGIKMDSMVNSIISECIWGKISTTSNKFGHYWEMISNIPSHLPPQEALVNDCYVTFGDYLERHVASHPDFSEAKDNFCITRDKKKTLKETFTHRDCVGETCKDAYHKLLSALQYECTEDSNKIKHHHIIPSFFHMLAELTKRRDIMFKIIFRTFGNDISSVADDLNLFCEGRHPTNKEGHIRMDGSVDGYEDRRLVLPYCTGKIKRFNNTRTGLHFAFVNSDDKV